MKSRSTATIKSQRIKQMKREVYRKTRELRDKYDNVMVWYNEDDNNQFVDGKIEIVNKNNILESVEFGVVFNTHKSEITFWKDRNNKIDKSIGWKVKEIAGNFKKGGQLNE